MTLPGVAVSFVDQASGLGSGTADGVQLKIGVSSLGTANTIYSLTQPSDVRSKLGVGPLVEAAAHHLGSGAASVVLCMPINASVAGVNGSVTATGGGPTVTLSGTPNDAYSFKVIVTKAGGNTTAVFKLSRDGGNNYGDGITMAATYVDAASGVTFNFAVGAYTTAHSYTSQATAPGYSTGDLTTALAAAKISGYDFDTIHVVGVASTLANDATKATTLDGVLQGWETYGLDVAGLIEVGGAGDGSDDAAILTAFAAVVAPTTGAMAGNVKLVEEDGEINTRSAGFPMAAHAARVARYQNGIATQPMQTVGGALPSIQSLLRDENKTPGLDDGRFWTMRTHPRTPGYYITNGYTLAAASSDVSDWPFRMVINKAKRTARTALFPLVGSVVRLNADGTITDEEAKRIESRVEKALEAALVDSKNAVAVVVTCDRTNNISLTKTVLISIRVTPWGYAKSVTATIGFTPFV